MTQVDALNGRLSWREQIFELNAQLHHNEHPPPSAQDSEIVQNAEAAVKQLIAVAVAQSGELERTTEAQHMSQLQAPLQAESKAVGKLSDELVVHKPICGTSSPSEYQSNREDIAKVRTELEQAWKSHAVAAESKISELEEEKAKCVADAEAQKLKMEAQGRLMTLHLEEAEMKAAEAEKLVVELKNFFPNKEHPPSQALQLLERRAAAAEARILELEQEQTDVKAARYRESVAMDECQKMGQQLLHYEACVTEAQRLLGEEMARSSGLQIECDTLKHQILQMRAEPLRAAHEQLRTSTVQQGRVNDEMLQVRAEQLQVRAEQLRAAQLREDSSKQQLMDEEKATFWEQLDVIQNRATSPTTQTSNVSSARIGTHTPPANVSGTLSPPTLHGFQYVLQPCVAAPSSNVIWLPAAHQRSPTFF